jgi:hypothetical protein
MSLSKITFYRNKLSPLIISHPIKPAILVPFLPPYWKYSINKFEFNYECIFNETTMIQMNITYPKNNGNLICINILNVSIDERGLKEYFKTEYINYYKLDDQNKYQIDIQYDDILDIPIRIRKIKQYMQKMYLGEEYENEQLWTCMEIFNTRGLTKKWYRENNELSVNTVFDKIYFRYTITFEQYIEYIEHFNKLLYDSKISHYYAGNKIVFVVPKIIQSTLYEKVEHYWIFLSFFFNTIDICLNNMKKER